MTAVDWKVGDRGRIGDAEFVVTDVGSGGVFIRCDGFHDWKSGHPAPLLAAMGAVRLPPPVPPTIGTPQSVKGNPPPADQFVLVWGTPLMGNARWCVSVSGREALSYQWWMPMPAPPPGVAS